MTDHLPPRVRTAADTSRFGPLVARVAHPNGRVYLMAYGLWALLAAANPVALVVSAALGRLVEEGESPRWGAIVVIGGGTTALAAYLGFLAVGSVTRRAFYLFPQGYVATGASGRVSRVAKWEDVGGIAGVGPGYHVHVRVLFGKPRVVCRIEHHLGRPIKFTEPADRMVLAPLAEELRARAVDPPR